jgi:hypothetical protein
VTISGSGQTPAFNLSDLKIGAVTVNITAVAGTDPVLTMYLQESDDGGTTWYDAVADVVQQTTTAGVELTATTVKRNIMSSATAAGTYRARYDNLSSDYYRIKYVITGTGPQFTLSASLNAK